MAELLFQDYDFLVPTIENQTWVFSSGNFEFNSYAGFHKAGNNCLHAIFPDISTFEGFSLNPDDLLDFSGDRIDPDAIIYNNKGPLIFGVFGLLFAFTLLLFGLGWCCVRCCICFSGGKSKGKSPKKQPEVAWEYVANRFGGSSRTALASEDQEPRGGKSSKCLQIGCGAALAVFCAVYLSMLTGLFVMNDQFESSNSEIFKDIDNAKADAETYKNLTQDQISAVFVISFGMLIPGLKCENPESVIEESICEFGAKLKDYAHKFNRALEEIPLNDTREDLKEVEEEFDSARAFVFHSINGLNLFLLLILVLISVGTVFSYIQVTKKVGGVLTNCGIILTFTFGWIIWIFCLGTFFLSGAMVVVVPGAFENILNNGSLVNSRQQPRLDGYNLPPATHILQSCRDGQSAYKVFNLSQIYDVENQLHKDICFALGYTDEHCTEYKITCDPEDSPIPVPEYLCKQVVEYGDFVTNTTLNIVGKCEPLYNVISSTLQIFSYELGSPIGGYWFGLNMILFLFYPILIITIVLQSIRRS